MSDNIFVQTLTERLADTVFAPFPEIARRARRWHRPDQPGGHPRDGRLWWPALAVCVPKTVG